MRLIHQAPFDKLELIDFENMSKLSFSGHETFHCRHFWLKKGYDFMKSQYRFSDAEAVVELGVGKNMVLAIRHWMRAFGLLEEQDQLTAFADYLFGENGKDPYLENFGTLWLLHYLLVKTEKASIYSLVFNEFRKERMEFNKNHLEAFINRKCAEEDFSVSENTIKKDIGVFLKNYLRPKNKFTNIEDDFTGILIDLDLIQELDIAETGGNSWFKIESSEREEIPKEILLFAILDNHENENSISLQKLLNDLHSVGSVFLINANGLIHKIEEITKDYPEVVFTDDAGIKELQIKTPLNKWNVLDAYYAN